MNFIICSDMSALVLGIIAAVTLYFSRNKHWSLLLCAMFLLGFGVWSIFSVSIYESFSLGLRPNWEGDPSNYFYFGRQIRNLILGLIMAVIVYKIPLKFFQNHKAIVLISVGVLILQLLIFVPGIGVEFQGSRGWIWLGGLTTIQPAEFFKLGYVLFLAGWFVRKRNSLQSIKMLTRFIGLNAIVFILFLAIPDLGSFLVMIGAGLVLCRYAGVRFKHIAVTGLVLGVGGLFLGILASLISPKFQYITQRFTYFIRRDVDPEMRQIGWQNQQALIAIGGGGFWGQGYGKGLQKFGFIPEAQSDFIFAAFSEEIGFVGNLILLGLYIYLCWYFLTHLYHIKDEHSKMLGVGIISLIIIQMFVNMGVNLKMLPNTGLTLPFISYGGTAIMVNMIQAVLLYKILTRK